MSAATDNKPVKTKFERLKALHQKREDAQRQNYKEVLEEDRRNKLPPNFENKKNKVEWEVEDERKRKDAKDQGEDYDRLKLLEITAETSDIKEKKRNKKRNPDPGFAGYEQAAIRKYERLTKLIKPNKKAYEDMKRKLGNEEFYPTANTLLIHLDPDPEENIERMAQDVQEQIARREKFSRRRTFNPDLDIDYINERNMKFNKKLERFYGSYTEEIKQNLERGTAL